MKIRVIESRYDSDKYDEAQNYIDNGMTTWREIFQVMIGDEYNEKNEVKNQRIY
jgi:hypothetical protein